MPFYDYTLVRGDTREIITERDRESAELEAAALAAVEWGKEIRQLSGSKADASQWPLSIVPSARDGGEALTPPLYQAKDVRPDEWGDETDVPGLTEQMHQTR